KETYTSEPPALAEKEETVRDHFHRVCPSLQMQMGFRWEKGLFQQRHAFVAKLAYEYQIFFYQNQFLRLLNNDPLLFAENQGDLTLSGGTFSLCFTF
ncbi:MAG: hypothetical protein JST18_12090, partial [Bacteroidetes bacterium]|nr:hypothetical protein [Bacteroidota bacterium]